MKKNVCDLALRGLETGVPQIEGNFVEMDDDCKIVGACYLGYVALGAGIPQGFAREWDPTEDSDNYGEALEGRINSFISITLLDDCKEYIYLGEEADQLLVSHRWSCPIVECDEPYHIMTRTGIIAHLNDKHHFSVEQINETLKMLGWC